MVSFCEIWYWLQHPALGRIVCIIDASKWNPPKILLLNIRTFTPKFSFGKLNFCSLNPWFWLVQPHYCHIYILLMNITFPHFLQFDLEQTKKTCWWTPTSWCHNPHFGFCLINLPFPHFLPFFPESIPSYSYFSCFSLIFSRFNQFNPTIFVPDLGTGGSLDELVQHLG